MRVHAIQTGTVAVRQSQREGSGPGPLRPLRPMLGGEWTEPLPILAWAIEHPEGVVVVDTGETARTGEPGYFPGWHPYFRRAVRFDVSPEDEIGPRLRAAGIEPGDVRRVVLTHLHTDHAGGLSHFPSSEILVTRTEYEGAAGAAGKLRGYLPHRWPEWFEPQLVELDPEPYGPFAGSRAVTADGAVRIVPTPGHTPGHVSVIVEDGDTALFLAGDTSYTQDLMLRGAIDGVSPDVRAARATLERIGELVRDRRVVYLPTHDPESAERLERRSPAPSSVSG